MGLITEHIQLLMDNRLPAALAAVLQLTDELPNMHHLCAIMVAANSPEKRGPYKKSPA